MTSDLGTAGYNCVAVVTTVESDTLRAVIMYVNKLATDFSCRLNKFTRL